MQDEDILLTVYCQSYNFGEYLRDAFNGFVNQKTNFKFRVFVYDDASTDDSAKIIKEYVGKYPGIFDAYISEKNMYNEPNAAEFLDGLRELHIKGKYIALCEGDDYWTDPYKLQKQVDFLEENQECSMVVHASHWINYTTGKEHDFHPYKESRYLTSEEVILQTGGNPSTASIVYRTRDLFLGKENTVTHVGDYTIQLYSLTRGKIYYIDEVMSVYRHQHKESWSARCTQNKLYAMEISHRMQVFLDNYDRETNYRFHEYVETKYLSYFLDPLLLDPSIEMDEYERHLEDWEKESGYSLKEYKSDIRRIGQIARGTYILTDEQMHLIEGSSRLLILGCGKYAEIIMHMLESNGQAIDGYLISDDQEYKDFMEEKNVWRFKDCPFDISSSVIFIGLSQKNECDVRKTLEKYNAKKVVDVFWIKRSLP